MRALYRTIAMTATFAIASGCYENFRDAEKIVTINNTTLYDSDIIADPSGNLHAVSRSSGALWYFKSTNEGASWSNAKIDEGNRPNHPVAPECRLHVDAYLDDIYVIYTEDNGDDGGRVNFRKSTDAGESWEESVVLRSGTAPKSDLQITSRGTFGGNTIVVAWREFNVDDWEARVRTSTDGGASFSSSVQASSGGHHRLLGLRYSADYSRVVLLYALAPSGNRYQTEIRSKYSSNGGLSWSGYTVIDQYGKQYDNLGGALELSAEDLVAFWSTNYHLGMSTSATGSSWSAAELISTGWNNRENLRAVFPEGLSGVLSYEANEDIYYRENDGTEWGDSRRLNNFVDGVSDYGGMTNENGELHAAWLDDRWSGFGDPELTWASAEATPTEGEFACSFSQSTTFPFVVRRETRTFDVVLGNWTSADESQDIWVEAVGENGLKKIIYSGTSELIPSQSEVTVSVSVTVPPRAPRQVYELTAYIGNYGKPRIVIDRDTFRATVE